MKKYVLLAMILFLASLTGFAQTKKGSNTPQQQDEFRKQMDILFGQLEHKRVPYGILLDFAMEFTNVPAFNGTLTDSTVINMTAFRQIYNTLLMGAINDEPSYFLLAPEKFEKTLKNTRDRDFVVITGLHMNYSKFADDALSANKLIYGTAKGDSVLLDSYINKVWQNPYEEKQTFAMTPAIETYQGLDLGIFIPRSLFFSNDKITNDIIKSDNNSSDGAFYMDFDNGTGYVKVPLDAKYFVKYTEGGEKTWKYKLVLKNETLYCQSKIQVKKMFEAIPWKDRFIH